MTKLALLVLALLLLAACQQAPSSPDYHVGTDGVTLSFLAGYPPQEVYEGSTVPVTIRLWNKGAADINYSVLRFSLGGDAFYANVTQDPLLERGPDDRWPLQQTYDYAKGLVLHGKGIGYPEGDYLDLHPIVTFKDIAGARESPSTQLFASLCYPYETVLGTSLCVDANAFNGNVQHQVCGAQTLTLQDQGAPVAVTSIENRPTPLRVQEEGGPLDIVEPTFVLHVKNVGPGAVVSAPVPDAQMADACALRGGQLNAVRVNASLSGLNLTCSPDPVPLVKGEGFTTCVLAYSKDVPISTPNYLGVLTVTLSYLYRETASADVDILRRETAVQPQGTSVRARDESPSFIDGVPRCDYCSAHASDPRCADWPATAKAGTYTCACTEQVCHDKYAKDKSCVLGYTWCPGTSFCCAS